MQILTGILNAVPGAFAQGMLWGIMTLGVYITFRMLHFSDLTVDGSFALGGIVSATLITSGMNPFVTMLAATICGAAAGAVTGLLHTKLKIPGILAGILTQIALYSINMRITGGASNVPLNKLDTMVSRLESWPIFQALGSAVHIGPFSILTKNLIAILIGAVFGALLIGFMYWFFGTEIGCALRATGSNEHMVRALGVNTDSMKILGLLFANALVSLSGALVAQSQGYGDVGMGTGTIVIGLAAIIIGEVLFKRRVRPFWYILITVILGTVVYYMIISIALQVGLKSTDLKLVTAVIVAIALALPTITQSFPAGKQRAIAGKQEG